MKKIAAMIALALFLTGCGKESAEEKYDRCNDEYADGAECTEEEFRDFLLLEYENDAEMFGGADEATAETQRQILTEVDDLVAEIFE